MRIFSSEILSQTLDLITNFRLGTSIVATYRQLTLLSSTNVDAQCGKTATVVSRNKSTVHTLCSKKRPPFNFWITLSRINRFWHFLIRWILRKFDLNILHTCPHHLSDVATLPWEVHKVIFNSIIHTYFRLFTLTQKKTNCNCCTAA